MSNGNRVLIISHDIVGRYMAGPGIRYYHMAQVLSADNQVTLAAPAPIQFQEQPRFNLLSYTTPAADDLSRAIDQADVIVVPAIWVAKIPRLQTTETPLVVDAYDPFVVETLARGIADVSALQQALAVAYIRGDFFICASERQRDWFLGILETFGRVNSQNFTADSTLRQLIDIAPYGLSAQPPQHTKQVIKGVWENISTDDDVILWGGGLWKWLDPLTAIKAVNKLWQERQNVRLVFPGTKHPNKNIPEILTHNTAAKQLAHDLDLLDKAVFFGEWIPYEDWGNVLLESDVALSLHFDSIETHLAYRSRILEYIAADLPTITTCGAVTSNLIEQHELGYVVDYRDVQGVANALRTALDERPFRHEKFRLLQKTLLWEQTLQPLINFCKDPCSAPDRTNHTAIGSAFYLSQIAQLQNRIQGYERGKFIRFMRWLKKIGR